MIQTVPFPLSISHADPIEYLTKRIRCSVYQDSESNMPAQAGAGDQPNSLSEIYYAEIMKSRTDRQYSLYFNKELMKMSRQEIERIRGEVIGEIWSRKREAFTKNVSPIIEHWQLLEKNPMPKPQAN